MELETVSGLSKICRHSAEFLEQNEKSIVSEIHFEPARATVGMRHRTGQFDT